MTLGAHGQLQGLGAHWELRADIHNTETIRWVVKNGELYGADTMKQVWPVEKALPPFFWKEKN